MLKTEQITPRKNTVLVEVYPPQVDKTSNGITTKTEEEAKKEAVQRIFRVGKVVLEGELDEKALSQLSIKGEKLTSLVDKTILFAKGSMDILDIKVDDMKYPAFINIDYIHSVLTIDDKPE